jgi:hypothetical protein
MIGRSAPSTGLAQLLFLEHGLEASIVQDPHRSEWIERKKIGGLFPE